MRAWPQPCCPCCRHVVYIADERLRCAFKSRLDPLYGAARAKLSAGRFACLLLPHCMCACSMPSWSQDSLLGTELQPILLRSLCTEVNELLVGTGHSPRRTSTRHGACACPARWHSFLPGHQGAQRRCPQE